MKCTLLKKKTKIPQLCYENILTPKMINSVLMFIYLFTIQCLHFYLNSFAVVAVIYSMKILDLSPQLLNSLVTHKNLKVNFI